MIIRYNDWQCEQGSCIAYKGANFYEATEIKVCLHRINTERELSTFIHFRM